MNNEPRTGANVARTATRRGVLRGGATVLVAAPALVGCGVFGSREPDALLDIAKAAEADAGAADAVAKAYPKLAAAAAVAKARREQALALRKEIARAAGDDEPAPAAPPASQAPGSQSTAAGQLVDALRQAQKAAATLVPTAPSYRAGLLASVAAGCAALQELFT